MPPSRRGRCRGLDLEPSCPHNRSTNTTSSRRLTTWSSSETWPQACGAYDLLQPEPLVEGVGHGGVAGRDVAAALGRIEAEGCRSPSPTPRLRYRGSMMVEGSPVRHCCSHCFFPPACSPCMQRIFGPDRALLASREGRCSKCSEGRMPKGFGWRITTIPHPATVSSSVPTPRVRAGLGCSRR